MNPYFCTKANDNRQTNISILYDEYWTQNEIEINDCHWLWCKNMDSIVRKGGNTKYIFLFHTLSYITLESANHIRWALWTILTLSRFKTSKVESNLIIIFHLKFPSSNVDMTILDARYTWSDQIASFGGIFGIWGELTGITFLGIINICLIIVKLFTCYLQKTIAR